MTTATDEQIAAKRAARLEYDRKRLARIKANPERHAAWLKQRAEARHRRRALKPLVPSSVDLVLYRQHGPFAQLFAL